MTTLRSNLKLALHHTRAELIDSKLRTYPRCPICRSKVWGGDLHEAIIPRSEIDYVPFEKQLQIFVPQNCVVVHSETCHKLAQHHERGKRICARYLIRWNGHQSIQNWLRYLQELNLTAAFEAEARLNAWGLLNG